MTKKTKILIATDSARIHTGLAETCRLVYKRLIEKYPDHYEIEQLGWFHNEKGPEKVPWKIHPTNIIREQGKPPQLDQGDRYGQRTFEFIRSQFQPDIVWTNGDLWCFDHLLNSPTRNSFRLCCYYTIDGSPYFGTHLEAGVKSDWGNKLAKTDRLAVLTESGVDTLHNSCPEIKDKHIDVVYHPVDIDRFTVLSDEQKHSLRDKMYPPTMPRDAFVLGWVGRNQFRKMNFKMWEVMHYMKFGDYIVCDDCERVTVQEYDHAARQSRVIGKLMKYDADYDYQHCWHCKSKNVKQGVPHDDIYLWMHMNQKDPGWKPDSMSEMYDVKDRITYTQGLKSSEGLPPEVLAQLISSWDGLLYLSGGEGFGVPAFEAMMAGVPIIYTNYSSHADFCKHGGLPVRVDFIPELGLSIHRSIADTNHAVERCLEAYNDRAAFKALGDKGRAFTETKTIDVIVDQWHGIFQEMMEQPLATEDAQHVYTEVV